MAPISILFVVVVAAAAVYVVIVAAASVFVVVVVVVVIVVVVVVVAAAAVVVVVVVAVVQIVAHGTNFSFPCRPGGVCDRWGSATGHLRRLAKSRAHTLSLPCSHVHMGCKQRMQCNAAVTHAKPLHAPT